MKNYLFPAGAVVAVVLWAMSITPANAADSTFSVDSYIPQKFTDFQLRLDGGLHIEGERTDKKASTVSGRRLAETDESYDVQEIRAAIATNYRYETVPRYLNLSLAVAGYDYNRNGEPGYVSDWPNHFKKGAQSSVDAGMYLVSDMFLSLTGTGTWDYGSGIGENATGHDRAYTTDVAVLPGWGRMYEGEYAATGMYIVEELRHNGILNYDPSYEEMLSLTELVHHYRQTHAIDERLHKIEALKEIIEYLQEIGAIDNTGPYGYLLIQDVWDYFPTFSRRFGLRLRVGAGMDYGYSSNDYSAEHKTAGQTTSHIYRHYRTTNEAPYIAVIGEWRRPLGLRWQFDLEEESRYFYDRRSEYERVNINYMAGSIQPLETVTKYTADMESHLAGTVRYILDSRSNARVTMSYDRVHFHSRTTQRGAPT